MRDDYGHVNNSPDAKGIEGTSPSSDEICEELLACPHCAHEFLVHFDLQAATHIYAVACPNCDRRFMARAIDDTALHPKPAYEGDREHERPPVPRQLSSKGAPPEPRVTPQTAFTYSPPFTVPPQHPYHPRPGSVVEEEYAPVEIKSSGRGLTRARVVSLLLIACFILGLLMGTFTLLADLEATTIEQDEGTVITLTGKIMDQNGTEIADATIRITDLTRTTTSNTAGFYYFDEIPTGEHKVIVYKDGYTTVARTVSVASQSQEFNFVLEPGSGQTDLGREPLSGSARPGYSGAMGLAILIFSVFVLFAAIMAFNRRGFVFVVVGGIFGICTIGFGIGSILAAIALVLTFISRTEFH